MPSGAWSIISRTYGKRYSIQAPHSSVGSSVSFAFLPSPQITSGRPCPLVLHAFGCPPTPHPGGAPRFVSKTTKPASPRFAGHTPQPMPGCFPHASDPHTGHILTQPQSDYAPAETSDRFHKLHINTVTQIPCGCVQPVVVTSRRSGNSWGRLARGFWSSGKSVGAEFGSHIFIFVSNLASYSQNYFQRYQ